MKKRYVGLLIAAALMAQPLTAYAAGSVSSRPSHDNSSSRSESLKTGKLEQSAAPVVNNGALPQVVLCHLPQTTMLFVRQDYPGI